ncbi:DUF29 family protein [Anabaena sp. FACHB-1237]|uniref:DUF29 family protein n=1 Tax=Anabaena sp. FACHB-1237 TaxID=2692769 RepID=UPI0016808EA0|nr:DUF29 family protein [Anabaena sp. FACHB-1237]MBD2137235.1 DUF29 family protein [Anabaena sp. FACHB-1237]
MTQELIDLRNSILEQRYSDALAIIDELEGMSKQAIIRNILSFVNILLIHLIKNHIEERLTNSWATSIRNSIMEIKRLNLKENKKSYYINVDEWEDLILDEVIDKAIADASDEVLNGAYNQFQLEEMIDKTELIGKGCQFLTLTYEHSTKTLPKAIAEVLIQLPGGENWFNRK